MSDETCDILIQVNCSFLYPFNSSRMNRLSYRDVLLWKRYILVRIFLVSLRKGGVLSHLLLLIQNVFLEGRRVSIGSKAQEIPPLSPAANQWTTMFLFIFLL